MRAPTTSDRAKTFNTRRRFVRPPAEHRRSFRLTARDVGILRWLARYRFLSAEHIMILDGGSKRVMRRLKVLFEHELVDRPLPQLVQLMASGSAPLVYALTREGARILEGIDGVDVQRLEWMTKPTRTSFLFMQHTLETAEAMVAFERACRDAQTFTLVDQHALLADMPEATRAARNPFHWQAKVKSGGRTETVGLVPDRLFSIHIGAESRLNFALELDRGTMSVEPTSAARFFRQSSIAKKLSGYLEGWHTEEHKKWGFARLRVLLVMPSEKRIRSSLATLDRLTAGKGSGMFLFTTREALLRDGPLAEIWVGSKGSGVQLVQ